MSCSFSIKKGTSVSRDPVQAATDLHRALDQPDIKLSVFYCPAEIDLPALAQALHARFGNVNLVGCTTAGEITPLGCLAGAVTGFSLAGHDINAATQLIKLDPFDSTSCSGEVQSLLHGLEAGSDQQISAANTFEFLLIDGLAMHEEMAVSCVHQPLQGIDLIGGSAADDTRFKATRLYYRGEFHQGVALLSLVRTSLPFLSFSTQRFVESDRRMVVTRADLANRVVFEVNGKPAASEFARLVGLPITELTPMIFVTHPVVVRIGGRYFVRSIATVNEDESLTFFCAIDEGIVLKIARGVDLVQNLTEAFEKVRTTIAPPLLELGCDCILRRLKCEREGVKKPVGQIFSDNNAIGFATYGEQFNSMHVNQTFTGIAIVQPA
jgi:hypothetical protein